MLNPPQICPRAHSDQSHPPKATAAQPTQPLTFRTPQTAAKSGWAGKLSNQHPQVDKHRQTDTGPLPTQSRLPKPPLPTDKYLITRLTMSFGHLSSRNCFFSELTLIITDDELSAELTLANRKHGFRRVETTQGPNHCLP